jgi:Asp-tRNA(Asn)/Glu-tRNA(Gln) amidotransferase A subunit family amidase
MVSKVWFRKKNSESGYDLRPVNAPRLSGTALRWAPWILQLPGIRQIFVLSTFWNLGLYRFRRFSTHHAPRFQPLAPIPAGAPSAEEAARSVQIFQDFFLNTTRKSVGWVEERDPASPAGEEEPEEPRQFAPETAADFARAYRSGRITPLQVAQRLLDVLQNLEGSAVPLRPLVAWEEEDLLEQARASTQRFAEEKPLGFWDGVPCAIKDEFHLRGFPTQVGCRLFSADPVNLDSEVVRRLRESGALLIGKAHMHELGMGVTGVSTADGVARNPHDPERYPGGSSSGCAVSVSVGLCPLALGADAGGSIRIPSSLCGVVGLKPTWGRVTPQDKVHLGWTVGHVGPLGASVGDVALGYAQIAGPCEQDPWSQLQPPVTLPDPEKPVPDGVRLGLFSDWFSDADPEVLSACSEAVSWLEQQGLSRNSVRLPSLEMLRSALLVTVLSEMAACAEEVGSFWRGAGPDARINLNLSQELSAEDYLRAQRIRQFWLEKMEVLFRKVDVLVTPTTAITAPRIPEDVHLAGESDLPTTTRLMQYVLMPNLTGYPALSVPVGYDASGMPIGLQLIARPWEEDLLLGLGLRLEEFLQKKQPMRHYRLLSQ